MPLFCDEFPVTTVNFGEGDWVSIRPLPKSYFNNEEKQLVAIAKGFGIKGISSGNIILDEKQLDPESMAALVEKEAELEYLRIKNSIVEWSSDREISIENIKKMPESVYTKLVKEIDRINHLSDEEIKN